jgi:hypothetical protein
MRVLAVPKLGPPAQNLIGAVLPTATRHARGRVVNFKSARQTGKKGLLLAAECSSPSAKNFLKVHLLDPWDEGLSHHLTKSNPGLSAQVSG